MPRLAIEDLNKALSYIDVKADWIGLREVNEITTYRAIRDGNPETNSRNIDHGLITNRKKTINSGAEDEMKQDQCFSVQPIF